MRPVRLGIDVGGTKILGVAIDATDPATPLASCRVLTPTTIAALIDTIVAVVRTLERDAELDGGTTPIGLGIPGVVDHAGVVWGAPTLRHAVGEPVRALIEHALGVPVRVGNDATGALWAEARFGAGRGVDDIVQVSLGTGIGGGVMVGGVLCLGRHGFAGEPGHMVVERDGVLCPCGRRGCWERYASGAGLAWLAEQRIATGGARRIIDLAEGAPADVRGEHVALAAREGDPDALAIWDEFAAWLALGLGNLADIVDPELFVIGGGLATEADLFLPQVGRLFPAETLGADGRRSVRIEAAALGADSAAIGAALLAGE